MLSGVEKRILDQAGGHGVLLQAPALTCSAALAKLLNFSGEGSDWAT